MVYEHSHKILCCVSDQMLGDFVTFVKIICVKGRKKKRKRKKKLARRGYGLHIVTHAFLKESYLQPFKPNLQLRLNFHVGKTEEGA